MVVALIFSAHLIFTLVVFTKKWQTDSLGGAIQNLILIIILFAIGWSLSTPLTNLIFPTKGFGLHYDNNAISLTILTIVEFFFYKMFYKDLFSIEAGTGK